MNGRVIIVLRQDLANYPPALSLIYALLQSKRNVIFIGYYSDNYQMRQLEEAGVVFCLLKTKYSFHSNILKKWMYFQSNRKEILSILRDLKVSKDDLLWLMETARVKYHMISQFGTLTKSYNVIYHFYELPEPKMHWSLRLFSNKINVSDILDNAYKVVCCEFNRAHIVKGFFNLRHLPFVLPNKGYFDEDIINNPPEDIVRTLNSIRKKINGKKVILYQGIFMDKERRLEEFCDAVLNMSEEYVLLAMGKGELFDSLQSRYSKSDKILFIAFIRPPYHLNITRLATIGILTYFPSNADVSSVLNPLYCAPNKIFEYARYSVPMISNDLPGLHSVFKDYHCGENIEYPISVPGILSAIGKITGDYASYAEGAKKYYESVDLPRIVEKILGE